MAQHHDEFPDTYDDDNDVVEVVDARQVGCVTCNAPPGIPCLGLGDVVHLARAAHAVSAGCRSRHPSNFRP